MDKILQFPGANTPSPRELQIQTEGKMIMELLNVHSKYQETVSLAACLGAFEVAKAEIISMYKTLSN